jgi:cytidine deaminase
MDTIDQLFDAARAARANAYAPYSEFPVGAAIRTATGAIFSGCNVENAAYPSGVCAETAAIAAMAVAGERRITDVLVVGGEARTIAPCGACRQRIFEFSTDKTLVYLANASGIVRGVPLGELLPRAFGPRDLAAGNRVSDRDEQ